MRKINEEEFKDFTVDCGSFKVTFGTLGKAMRLFDEREGRCTVIGNRFDGSKAVVDSKQ